ncbi:MAG: glycosyltransferase [Bdellovibrionales bacterium]
MRSNRIESTTDTSHGMPNRIAFLLADFQSGGTEWFALRLARGFLLKDIKPIFFVLNPQGDLEPLVDEGIEIISLGSKGYSFSKALSALPALVRALQKSRPDVLLGGLTILNIVASLALIVARVPTRFIAIEHMRLGTSPVSNSLWAQIKRQLKIALVRLSYARADKIVAVSQSAKQDLIHCAKIAPNKINVIHNPIIPEDFAALRAKEPPHPWLRDKTTPVIVSIGRLLENKDFSSLLRAFEKITHATKARLIIFGEGDERPALEALIKELDLSSRATLGGQIDNVFSALNAADLFVLPSRSEAFGNVIVEALACGCPVVSTDSGGPREILENGALGILVPPNDTKELASAMLCFITLSPSGKSQRLAHGQSYDVESTVQAYLALLEN